MEENKEIALILTGTLPTISGNFDACKAFYAQELKKYEMVVTEESLPVAKADLAKLRTEMKRLERIRIDEATRLKAPVSAMEAQVKELVQIIDKAAQKIAEQVAVYTKKTLSLCQELMTTMLDAEYVRLEVRSEYQKGLPMIAELIGTSKVTKGGALTAEAKRNIEGLAMQGRNAQLQADGRMDKVKAECLTAGIEPLTRENVLAFIDADDSVFLPKLKSMIDSEVKRANAAREKIRLEEEDKARKKMEAERAEQKRKDDAAAEEKRIAEKIEADKKKVDAAGKWLTADPKAASAVPLYGTEKAVETPKQEEPKPPVVSPESILEPTITPTEGREVVYVDFAFRMGVSAKIPADQGKIKAALGGIIVKYLKKADPRIVSIVEK